MGLFAVALAVRLPFVVRVGPNEGGGDEWYSAWRTWSVLFERGNPGNFLHPALFYEAGAALVAGLYLVGELAGAFQSTGDLLTDFVLHEAKYLQALQGLAAIFGALTVPVVFELGRRISGWRAGAIAAALLAVLPLHVEYSQRVRVDSLCVLLTALGAVALHQLVERGRRRDFVVSGAMIGLATSANYPAVLLGVAYLLAASLARNRGAVPEVVRSVGLGIVAAAAAFALTNPYMLLTPAAAWEGFLFQLSFAVSPHPYNENVSRWFYLDLLRDQGVSFAVLAACASVWLTVRAHGFRRVLGLVPWLFIGTFMALSTQADRYILIAMPWLCVGIGVFLAEVSAGRRPVAAASLVVVALAVVGLWRQASPRVLVERAGENPRWAMQRWLLQHARAGATVWLESDALPLLQATFVDPGGELQRRLQQAFRNAYPEFRGRFLKGELVERSANFDPALITEKRVDLALTCDRTVRYVEGRPEFAAPRAFYAALAERGTRRYEALGCSIAEIR